MMMVLVFHKNIILYLYHSILGALYRPPAASVEMFLEDFLSYFGFLLSFFSYFVLCGNFNIHVDSVPPLISEFKPVVDA